MGFERSNKALIAWGMLTLALSGCTATSAPTPETKQEPQAIRVQAPSLRDQAVDPDIGRWAVVTTPAAFGCSMKREPMETRNWRPARTSWGSDAMSHLR